MHVKVVIRVEHLHECPLSPFVIFRIACADFSAPVERETYLVELGTITCDVFRCGFFRMLTCLYGILLGGKTVCVIAHGMKHVEALLAFEACVDVACYISQRVTDVKSGSGGVGEHVKDIEFFLVRVLDSFVGLVLSPVVLPSAFNFLMIVFHNWLFEFLFSVNCKINKKKGDIMTLFCCWL